MDFARRALAETSLLPGRLLRTGLGLRLLVLSGGLWWLQHGDPAADPVGIAVLAGTLGAVMCIDGLAASKGDRAALAHRLLQPTSPAAISVGRWFGALGGASLLVFLLSGYGAWSTTGTAVSAAATLAGVCAAVATSAVALAAVLIGGHPAAGMALLWFLVVSPASPETILGLGHHGTSANILASLLEVAPSVWRYRGIATGDVRAMLHAIAWGGSGLAIATWRVSRLGRRAL